MYLKQSTASQVIELGPFIDDTDFKSAKTGLTIANTDIKLRVAGGTSHASKNSGGATHIANGYYHSTLDATDTATVGQLDVHVNATGALAVRHRFWVLEEAVYDMLFGASAQGYITDQPVNVTKFGGSSGTFASGRPEVNASHIAGSSVSTSSAQIGVNVVNAGGTAWGSGAITAASIASDAITAAKIADNAIDRATFAADTGLQSIRSNTAQAGASTTITLDASASSTDDFYNKCSILLTGGTGAGQFRIISDYVGSTKVATVSAAWVTNPSSSSTFAIFPAADSSADIADAVWDEALSGHTTTGTAGKALSDAGGAASPATIADAVWDEARSGHVTSGTFGEGVLLASSAISSSTFALNAITASAIAADAIGASELAADAVTEIAAGVWQDATAGDFTVANSIGKALYINNVAPGGSGGHMISGSNSGTTTLAALTVSGATTLTGAVTASNASNNVVGIDVAKISGDSTAADNAESFFDGTGYAGTNNVIPTVTTVNGLAAGVITATSIASNAITSAKIATDAITSAQMASTAITEIAAGVWDEAASSHTTAGSFGQSHQMLRTGTAQAGAAGSITLDASASAVDDFYKNAVVQIVSGTGANQAHTIGGYTGSTKVATVTPNWGTTPDNTSVFVIRPVGAIAGASAPTASEVADAVWDEARSGHVSSGTFGEYALADVVKISGDATAADNSESFFDGTGYAGTNNVIPTVTTVTNTINADMVKISGDTTAADNAESYFDGTGYAGTNNVIPTVTNVSNGVTVATNNDKTNYRLSATGVDDVWDEAQSGHTNAGTFGKYLDSAVSGVSTGGLTPTDISNAVWDATRAGHVTSGTFGQGVASVQGNVTGSVASVTGNVAGNVTGSVGSVASGGITSSSFAANSITASALAADAVDEILDEQIGDTTLTMRQALKIAVSALAGKLSGAATSTVTIRNAADTTNVIVATVDDDGNRTAITLSV